MHTNRFRSVKKNIKPEVLKVPTVLERSVHQDRGLVFLYNNKTGQYEFYYLIASNFD